MIVGQLRGEVAYHLWLSLSCRSEHTSLIVGICSSLFLILKVGRCLLYGRERGCEARHITANKPAPIRIHLKLQSKVAPMLNIPFHTLKIYCHVVREPFEVFDQDARPRCDWPLFRSYRRSRLHPCAHQAWSHACSIVTPLYQLRSSVRPIIPSPLPL